MSFWRRHRRKFYAAAAIGAAGAAAASLYWWYSTDQEEQRQREKAQQQMTTAINEIVDGGRTLSRRNQPGGATSRSTSQPGAAGAGADGGSDAAAGDEEGGGEPRSPRSAMDASLQHHFDSIQGLSDRQALEDLLPRLRAQVFQAADIDPVREACKAMAGDASVPQEQKLAAWLHLAHVSFTRCMAACVLVPVLDLLVRMKLHIVGRHMYLESRLPEISGAGGAARGGYGGPGRPQMPPRLSDRAKEEFFRSDFFIEVGLVGLVNRVAQATQQVLGGVDLALSVSAADVEALLLQQLALLEAGFEGGLDLWQAFLLPPGQQPVQLRSASGVESFMSPIEAAMVDELNGELRTILRDYHWVGAIRAAIRHVVRGVGLHICSKMEGRASPGCQDGATAGSTSPAATSAQQPAAAAQAPGSPSSRRATGTPAAAAEPPVVQPFPFVVPVVAKSANLVFEETSRCTKGISSIQAVQALCANVFTFGPHIC